MPIDDHLDHLRALAQAAADSVPPPVDLAASVRAHEEALAAEFRAELLAANGGRPAKRPWSPAATRHGLTLIGQRASQPRDVTSYLAEMQRRWHQQQGRH